MTALALRNDVLNGAAVKCVIKSKIDISEYNAWIEPLKVCEDKNVIILTAASRFNADFIRATFGAVLRDVENECGVPINLTFARPNLRVIKNPANQNVRQVLQNSSDLFDGFVCNAANQFALSALKKCAMGRISFSPLVIYGASGSGKSILLEFLRQSAEMRVVMTTGAQFVSDFVRAMRTNSAFAFKDAMRACDMFIMDDVQGLAGKRASAGEFLSLLDDLIRMGKNVVLTLNIAPSQITGFDKRMISLLASGLAVDLALPDKDVSEKILIKSGISESVAKSIAARTPPNGHIISGICKKIAAWRELDCGDLSGSVLEKLLADVLEKENTPLVMVKNMCAKLGVAFDDVMSATRTRAVVFA
ncbi:MAG: AAA family ATPase, partial [Rickettsiales bacterium]|nr:AAA family ATPase [Rickettsiales bacterium]